ERERSKSHDIPGDHKPPSFRRHPVCEGRKWQVAKEICPTHGDQTGRRFCAATVQDSHRNSSTPRHPEPRQDPVSNYTTRKDKLTAAPHRPNENKMSDA